MRRLQVENQTAVPADVGRYPSEYSANPKESPMQFRLSTLIWAVSVAAACLATCRFNVIYAPLVSTFFAALFLFRESRSPNRSTANLVRIGASSAAIGTFAYMVWRLSLDFAAALSVPGEFIGLSMLFRMILVSVAFTFLYVAIASCLGSLYGLCCAVGLRMANRDAIRHAES